MNFIPLLSPAFSTHTQESWHTFVKSLYREPVRAKPPAAYSVRVNEKGTLCLTVRRKPKYLTPQEVDQIANEVRWTKQQTWLAVTKKKVEVRRELSRRK